VSIEVKELRQKKVGNEQDIQDKNVLEPAVLSSFNFVLWYYYWGKKRELKIFSEFIICTCDIYL